MEHEFDQIPISKLVLRLGITCHVRQFFNILYSIVVRAFVGHIAADGDHCPCKYWHLRPRINSNYRFFLSCWNWRRFRYEYFYREKGL